MIAVTGANGHLGQRLLRALAGEPVRALVRSDRAADQVRGLGLTGAVDVRVVDYLDADVMAQALQGCTAVVHLVGIIRETSDNGYRQAHEQTCAALADAAARAGLERVVYLSILGASTASSNACLASKGAAEKLLLEGQVPATVIRVPMVLGEGDFASRALSARAARAWNVVLRSSSLEQPIYAGDVVAAVQAALRDSGPARALDLAGPESLSRRFLIHRAARVLGRRTRVVSLPLAAGTSLAFVLEKASANPPVTRAMLGVFDHDDRVDPTPAARSLGLRLTPLDQTLRLCLADQGQ